MFILQKINCGFLQALQVPSAVTYNLYDFAFDDIHMSDDDTLLVSILVCFHM